MNITLLSHQDYDTLGWFWHDWDYIVHLAHTDPHIVIECARNCNAKVLFASSGAVYNYPLTEYGKEKALWEMQFQGNDDINYNIARMYTFCGRKLKWPNFAIGNFIRDAVNGGPIVIRSDGKTIRTYMYGRDLGEWLWKILLDGEPQNIYDVGSLYASTIYELAQEICRNFKPWPGIIIEDEHKLEIAPYYMPKLPYMPDELLLTQRIPFDEAIRLSIKDYIEDAKNMPSLW